MNNTTTTTYTLSRWMTETLDRIYVTAADGTTVGYFQARTVRARAWKSTQSAQIDYSTTLPGDLAGRILDAIGAGDDSDGRAHFALVHACGRSITL